MILTTPLQRGNNDNLVIFAFSVKDCLPKQLVTKQQHQQLTIGFPIHIAVKKHQMSDRSNNILAVYLWVGGIV